jgi:hypothetical protein
MTWAGVLFAAFWSAIPCSCRLTKGNSEQIVSLSMQCQNLCVWVFLKLEPLMPEAFGSAMNEVS